MNVCVCLNYSAWDGACDSIVLILTYHPPPFYGTEKAVGHFQITFLIYLAVLVAHSLPVPLSG